MAGSSPVVFLFKTQDTDHKTNMLLTFRQVWQTQLDDLPMLRVEKNCQLVKVIWCQGQTLSSFTASICKYQMREAARSQQEREDRYSHEKLMEAPIKLYLLCLLSAQNQPLLLKRDNANYLPGLYYSVFSWCEGWKLLTLGLWPLE